MYNVMKMFNDGIERKKTLFCLAEEIRCTNPKMPVEIISRKNGRVWCGRASNVIFDLCDRYLKHCVQEIQEDEYGVTIIMR